MLPASNANRSPPLFSFCCRTCPARVWGNARPRPVARNPHLHPKHGVDIGPGCLGCCRTGATLNKRSAARSAGRPSTTPFPPYHGSILPPRVVQKILSLEFVEMAELRADIWPEDPPPAETANPQRRPGKPPVTNIRTWLDCYARMAAVMDTCFPEKAPELWAYHTTILHAAHAYEGANWVTYDCLFRRKMLAKKDLNWSVINSRL